MAMGGGASTKETVPYINMTPMIDILLVLLIISSSALNLIASNREFLKDRRRICQNNRRIRWPCWLRSRWTASRSS